MKAIHRSYSTSDILFMIAALWLGGAACALAWNGPGHMLVADIAWAALAGAPAVRNAIKAILQKAKGGFEPAGNSDSQVQDAFDYAATFSDHIKVPDTTEYEQLVLAMNPAFWPNGQPEVAAGKEGMRCRSWHFYDTPINLPHGNPPPHIYPSNLIVSWNESKKRLRQLHKGNYDGHHFAGFDNHDLKFWWLAWLLHLAGDAHQPLHCVSNYAFDPKGDAGGNRFILAGNVALHGFWDGLLVRTASQDHFHIAGVETTNGSPSALLVPVANAWKAGHAPTPAQTAEHDIAKWVSEGATAAKAVTYHNIQQGNAPSAAYVTAAENFARPAAVRGGARLAAVLQEIFA
jgi:S1/P1 Nuclease